MYRLKRSLGEISCDLASLFVLSFAFDLFGGGSFVEWLFVIDHYSLHPRPAGWVGRNTIRLLRLNAQLNTQWTRVLLCLNMKKNLIYRMFQSINMPCDQIYLHTLWHIFSSQHKEKCYIHCRAAKLCNWEKNSRAVRIDTMTKCSQFGHTYFDVQTHKHIVIERNWKQQMVWQSVILCSNIVSYLVLVLPVEL